MKLKEQIIQDIHDLVNPLILLQVFDFLELLKNNEPIQQSNTQAVLAFAGSMTKEDAEAMQQTMNQEFNDIEGEW